MPQYHITSTDATEKNHHGSFGTLAWLLQLLWPILLHLPVSNNCIDLPVLRYTRLGDCCAIVVGGTITTQCTPLIECLSLT